MRLMAPPSRAQTAIAHNAESTRYASDATFNFEPSRKISQTGRPRWNQVPSTG